MPKKATPGSEYAIADCSDPEWQVCVCVCVCVSACVSLCAYVREFACVFLHIHTHSILITIIYIRSLLTVDQPLNYPAHFSSLLAHYPGRYTGE